MESSDILPAIFAALLGFIVGVIINILADDLPNRKNPSLPHYPNGAPRSGLAWSGLLAFLTGQREGEAIEYSDEEERERGLSLEEIANLAYDTHLGWRHPLVEVGMAAIFAGLVLLAPDTTRLFIWFVYLSILMLVTVIDLEHRLILFVVIIPALVVTLILNALFPEDTPDGKRTFTDYLLGAVLGGGVFFLMFRGGGVFVDTLEAVRGRHISEVPFGFGDVMLAILCGAMIGWRAMIFAMFITVFAGAAGAILYIAYRLIIKRGYRMGTPLPYGPYIVLGTVVMMLFIEQIRELFRTA